MNNANQPDVHKSIQLQGVEKYVLAKIVAAETDLNAYEAISRGNNVVAARDKLAKLGLITVAENDAKITDSGTEALRKEALIDEMGELTEEGQIWGYANTAEEALKADAAKNAKPEAPVTPSQQQEPENAGMPSDATNVATQDASAPDQFSLESLEMIQGFREHLKEEAFRKKAKS
jgi:UTP:GlnB (protein PII) uridylyltransferase